jgi:DNA primase
MYKPDSIRRVRDLAAADYIGQFVKLKRESSLWVACCPFHDEKSASFKINPAKNTWKCFGCQKGGDLIKFVEEHDGVDFLEAVRILASMAGIELVELNDGKSPEERKQQKTEKDAMYELLEFACKLYEQELDDSHREALFNRGVTEADIKKWRIGFAPNNWRTLTTLVTADGRLPMAIKLKLVMEKEKGADVQYFDFYRNRIMIPICDEKNRPISFGAWNFLQEEYEGKVVKYINGSESPLYQKTQVLFGINHAKKAMIDAKKIGFAEGYFDVISAHRAGLTHVVASCGTAVTADMLQYVKKWSMERAEIFYDKDVAGERSCMRTVDLCLEYKLMPTVMEWPEGAKDLDDVVRKAEEIEW